MSLREILLADIEAKRREKAEKSPEFDFDDDLCLSDEPEPSDGGGYNPYDNPGDTGP